jgi:DNA-binding transcriptional regulator YiaG
MTKEQLKDWIVNHGMTNDQFARFIGVTQSCVMHWLFGRRSIPITAQRVMRLIDRYPEMQEEFGK